MLTKYVGSFLVTLMIVCLALSWLRFATLSNVKAGDVVEETWQHEVTLDLGNNRYLIVNDQVKEALEREIEFVASGPVRVKSARVEVTGKKVSFQANRKSYTAPGARIVSHVTWEAVAGAPDGERGQIEMRFPSPPEGRTYDPEIHSGPVQKEDGRWLVREVSVYGTPARVALARFAFVLTVGLPIALLLQGIWFSFMLRNFKQRAVAALTPQHPNHLPRIYYPSPIAEWFAWTVAGFAVGIVGAIYSGMVIASGYASSSLDRFMLIFQLSGLAIGLLTAWLVRANVVQVRVEHGEIAVAKGRRAEPKWVTARWPELRGATVRSQVYRGTTVEWVELAFPDGKKWKVRSSAVGYEELKDLVRRRYFGG